MTRKGYKKLGKRLLVTGTSFAAHQQWVGCIVPVLIQAQVDTVMIVMRAVMVEEMMSAMVTEGKENGDIGTRKDMATMGTHIIMREIVTGGSLTKVMSEIVMERMIPEEGVEVLMVIIMDQGAGAQIDTGIMFMMMMTIIPLEEVVSEEKTVPKMGGHSSASFLNNISVLLQVMKLLWVTREALLIVQGVEKH
uniref:Uncharacterized protein n=1 Tax=Opuntia streptacantha TaxID=393608 RepID=A0A7C8ZJB4_OPUST